MYLSNPSPNQFQSLRKATLEDSSSIQPAKHNMQHPTSRAPLHYEARGGKDRLYLFELVFGG